MVEERKIPAGYKNTEVGVIPEDWEVVSFERAFKFLSTGNNPRNELRDHGFVHYVHYGDIHIKWDRFLDCSKDTIPYIDEKSTIKMSKVKDGDLIMADVSEDLEGIGVSVEVLNVNNKNVVAGLHTFLLRADKDIFADGFKGYIQEVKPFREELRKIATGISVYGISKTRLKKIKIPVPRFNEQQTIAEALGDMDDLLESVQKLIDKKQKIKDGAMQELLTGKRRLPGFTGKWKIKQLGAIFNISAGADLKTQFFSQNSDDKFCYPVYSNSLLNKGLYGFSSTFYYDKNSITVTARGSIGHAEARKGKFVAIGRLLVLLPLFNCNCYFMSEFINKNLSFAIESTGVPQLTAPQISRYSVFIPPLLEQQAIAQVLSDMDSEIDALEEKLNKYRAIKQGMMQELLTGRIRLI